MKELLTFENLSGGAAVTLGNRGLQEALDDIADANKNPTAPRTVNIKITLRPNKNRTIIKQSVESSVGRAPSRRSESELIFESHQGQGFAREMNNELALDFEGESKVVNMERTRTG